MPLAAEKVEGPTSITFLGIEIDTTVGVLCLPHDKLQWLVSMLHEWSGKRSCTRKEFESLIGSLQHACMVVKPGRAFLRRMIDLLRVAHHPYHHIRLNQEFRSDLARWISFAEHWNGVSFISGSLPSFSVDMASDVSGNWGCGAWHGKEWFQLEWLRYKITAMTSQCIEFSLTAHHWAYPATKATNSSLLCWSTGFDLGRLNTSSSL